MTGKSPRILHLSWGRIDIDGVGTVKDAKLFPGGGREWDWSETGTRHEPGIQPADVEELLAHGATTVVLSRGMQQQLNVAPDTVELLKTKGVTVHIAPTEEAVDIYHSLLDSEPVAGLFHSTC